MIKRPSAQKVVWYKSLYIQILAWLLLFSLVPLVIITWQSYSKNIESVQAAVASELKHVSPNYVNFIDNWFFYRFNDMNTWSERTNTIAFTTKLSELYDRSKSSLNDFVLGYDYTKLVKAYEADFINLTYQYDYIYDLFLFDLKGNLLYTVVKESDLGTNYLHGKYSKTRFAQAYRDTLKTHNTEFSDLEHYAPSQNGIYGFITVPVIGSSGDMIGVMAVQIKLDRIITQFQNINNLRNGLLHYLVGEDGYLRSPIDFDTDNKQILQKRIDTLQTRKYHEKSNNPTNTQDVQEILEYEDSNGDTVYGTHHRVEIFGKRWVLISEMRKSFALQASQALIRDSYIVIGVTFLLVLIVALMVSRRITNPLQQLALASYNVARGHAYQSVEISGEGEIAQLAYALNQMQIQQEESIEKMQQNEMIAQNALHELKEQKLALDAHAIVAITDIHGTITYANNKFAEISKYAIDELIGQNHRILNSGFHPASFWTSMFNTVLQGKIWHEEVCNRDKEGNLYWVDTTIVPFQDSDGHVMSLIAIRADITERKAVEQKNKEALTLNDAILNSTNDGILVTDAKGEILHFNQRFLDMWSIPQSVAESRDKERLMGAVMSSLKDPDGFVQLIIERNSNFTDSFVDLIEFNDERVLERQTLPMYIEGSAAGRVWSFSDVTEKRAYEQQLINSKEEAQQAARAKAEFLASMSHEIRTPMNGVLGMLGLLQRTHLDKTQRHQASIAQSSAESLLTIINDILDFSKVEAGKLELEELEFNLRNDLGGFAEAIALKAQEKDVELILDVTQVERTLVVTDPGRLRQVLTNLVGNAIKFTHEGEILITVRLEQIAEGKGKLSVEVKDTGIGIPEDKQAALFDSFTQVDTSTTRKYGGTGLGLSIAKQLIELMGGEISVSSTMGEGSTFRFYINVGLPKHSSLVMPKVSVEGKKVLIVDDNSVNLEVLDAQLQLWGMNVTAANSAENALSILEKQQFDIALLDMHMPEMDGAELGKRIRSQASLDSMKLVMMTSLGSRDEAQVFADIGFEGYFPKPTTTQDLFHALSILMAEQAPSDEVNPILTKDRLDMLESKEVVWSKETRILLVEDNMTNQLVAKSMLSTHNLEADTANNGEEALAQLQSGLETQPYALVFMDCQMPVMDGYSASEAIRAGKAGQENTHIPIVAMTANAMKGDKEKCIASGMDDYISKPINPNELTRVLDKWIDKEKEEDV